MGQINPGTLWIRTWHPEHREVKCLMGDTPPRVNGPYARFGIIDRPKRRSVPEWQGNTPLVIDLSFVIDYFSDPFDDPAIRCENDIATLEYMAGYSKDGDTSPPLVLWDANGPHDDADNGDLRWWVTNLTWGDAMWASTGRRIRQAGSIELTEYVEDDYITAHGAARARRRSRREHVGHHHTRKHYTVKKGDTLQKIASKQLGNANLWTTLAKLNGIRDPKRLKVGRKLRLP